jgi:putative restriction endonuclease
MMARVFGDIAGVAVGATFTTRQALAQAGLHRPLQAGISGGGKEGADSVVLSGGYEDDRDDGETIIMLSTGLR